MTRLRLRPRADAVGLLTLGTALTVLGPVLGRREALSLGLFLLVLALASLAATLLQLHRARRECERVWAGLTASRPTGPLGLHERLTPLTLTATAAPLLGDRLDLELPEAFRPDDGRAPTSAAPPGHDGRAGTRWVPLHGDGLTVTPRWRGRFTFDHARCRVVGPFGLWTAHRILDVPATAAVSIGPQHRRLPAGLVQTITAQVRTASGARRRQRPDDVSLREHSAGDSLHRVHWGATARSGRLMVRAEEPEERAPVRLLVDRGLTDGPRRELLLRSGRRIVTDEGLETVVATAAALQTALSAHDGTVVDVVDHTGERLDPALVWTDLVGLAEDAEWSPHAVGAPAAELSVVAVVGASAARPPRAPREGACAVLATPQAAAQADRWRAAGWTVVVDEAEEHR